MNEEPSTRMIWSPGPTGLSSGARAADSGAVLVIAGRSARNIAFRRGRSFHPQPHPDVAACPVGARLPLRPDHLNLRRRSETEPSKEDSIAREDPWSPPSRPLRGTSG